ncbi:hypothetical protein SAMN05216338_105717 [Bradyrhizobium sp. Rc2d]|nr:hypothetical protein SAMN05216338_105717 [Bradyrhizobium sp. Rc2d]
MSDEMGTFDTKTLRETTEVITDSGSYWSLVREGVICTKGLGHCETRVTSRDNSPSVMPVSDSSKPIRGGRSIRAATSRRRNRSHR